MDLPNWHIRSYILTFSWTITNRLAVKVFITLVQIRRAIIVTQYQRNLLDGWLRFKWMVSNTTDQ